MCMLLNDMQVSLRQRFGLEKTLAFSTKTGFGLYTGAGLGASITEVELDRKKTYQG